jgi:hypothetical protein
MYDHYPIVIIQDRYGGCYSGGAWLAISRADQLENGAYRIVRCLEGGPHDGDVEAREFWENPPPWIAAGATPEEAIKKLPKVNQDSTMKDQSQGEGWTGRAVVRE